MRHSRDPNELLEVLGDELRVVVRDDARPRFRVLLLRSLEDDLDVRLGAYKDLLTLWKDADPHIPAVQEAKAEFAKQQ